MNKKLKDTFKPYYTLKRQSLRKVFLKMFLKLFEKKVAKAWERLEARPDAGGKRKKKTKGISNKLGNFQSIQKIFRLLWHDTIMNVSRAPPLLFSPFPFPFCLNENKTLISGKMNCGTGQLSLSIKTSLAKTFFYLTFCIK